MQVSLRTLILAVVLTAAGVYALAREGATSETVRTTDVREARPELPLDHGAGMMEGDPAEDDPSQQPGSAQDPSPDDEAAAIRWTVPAGWRTLPNPSSMRIATYAVPRAAGDTADADVSVTRVGGDVSSNIDRWAGQFEGGGEPKRRSQTVHGLEVIVVEIEGTYASGMASDTKPRPGWALLAAIVKTPGLPYFFKMTGPASTVHGAHSAFTTLVESIQPTD